MWESFTQVTELYQEYTDKPLLGNLEYSETVLNREAIENLLPHRSPFLFLDKISTVNTVQGTISAIATLSNPLFKQICNTNLLATTQVVPEVFQLEGIGQAAAVLCGLRDNLESGTKLFPTHIHKANFLKPAFSDQRLHFVAQLLDDTLFYSFLGQCVQGGQVKTICLINLLKI